MKYTKAFWREDELELARQFSETGYIILPAEDLNALNRIRDLIASIASSFLKLPEPDDKNEFLNNIHTQVSVERLNDLRLTVIRQMNQEDWVRPCYFQIARRALEVIVGNELAMQLRINLSIQMPKDTSSLLPVHADTWAGDSPYEIVLWIPYVDVAETKSMYFLPRAAHESFVTHMADFRDNSSEELYEAIKPQLHWLNIPYGHVLLFTQNMMHGNTINEEKETRWSSNCRFKTLFSPYADKKLGEFFEPIVVRPATQLGAGYTLPDLDSTQ